MEDEILFASSIPHHLYTHLYNKILLTRFYVCVCVYIYSDNEREFKRFRAYSSAGLRRRMGHSIVGRKRLRARANKKIGEHVINV